nr:hypothetical protein [Pandoravirus massiliensis]
MDAPQSPVGECHGVFFVFFCFVGTRQANGAVGLGCPLCDRSLPALFFFCTVSLPAAAAIGLVLMALHVSPPPRAPKTERACARPIGSPNSQIGSKEIHKKIKEASQNRRQTVSLLIEKCRQQACLTSVCLQLGADKTTTCKIFFETIQ